MKILYFSRDYTTHDYRFLVRLADSQHDVFFLRLENDGAGYEKRPLPSKVVCLPWQGTQNPIRDPKDILPLMPCLDNILREISPDIIQAGPLHTATFMCALTSFSPLVYMSWGSDFLVDAQKDALHRWVARHTIKHCDFLLCDCDAVRLKAMQQFSFPPERILQFPWGVDLNAFSPDAPAIPLRQIPGWNDATIVLCTRSWQPIYGIEITLEAFAAAYQQNKKLRLALLSGGPLAPKILEIITKHSLEKVVTMPGVTPQNVQPHYFAAADIYLSTSFSDGSSVSLLEALASGLPVVVSDLPSNREWLKERENGWFAPPGEVEAFTQALLEAASLSTERRKEIGELNRAICKERADWNKNSEQLISLYDSLAESMAVK